MFIQTLAAAATDAAPQNKFGFVEALQAGGFISYATVVILGIMSFGSFFILFTKFFEQQKILGQYKSIAGFWRAASLKEGATKLEKNSAWRQVVNKNLNSGDESGPNRLATGQCGLRPHSNAGVDLLATCRTSSWKAEKQRKIQYFHLNAWCRGNGRHQGKKTPMEKHDYSDYDC